MSIRLEPPPLTRRAVLRGAGGLVAGALLGPALSACVSSGPRWRQGFPFALGVAAGCPAPDGFVLWTRLAPDPLSTDPEAPGGLRGDAIEVVYEIATDPQLRQVVRRAAAVAEPGYAFSVHAEIVGLAPGRPYWYRFRCGDAASRIGCARTAPGTGTPVDHLRFGYVSCSNYEHGYFSAYRHLADESAELVIFLGDYLYEKVSTTPELRRHSDGVSAHDLPTYRNRHAQYRLDPDLQRLHAEATALLTWDDHEVRNDYADRWSEDFEDPETFLLRRAAAYRAYYEHMPLRPSRSRPAGPSLQLYDRLAWGDLAEIHVLDGRQYRSQEACYRPPYGGGHLETTKACPQLLDESRSMLGSAQERWLNAGLAESHASWNLIAQDVMMARLRERTPDGEIAYWTDDWNGYPAARTRLLRTLHEGRIANPVVLTGDIHSFWANELRLDFDDPHSPVVATELVGTSVSAHGVPYEKFAAFLPDNPHVRFFESRERGYASVDLTPTTMTTRFQIVSDVTDPKATVSTLKTFAVESGRPGPQEA
jgi:alkaline phosphatase D